MPKQQYVSPRAIGLTNESQIRVYKNCPSFESLNPDSKDLVIYGSPQYYTICSYNDFENRGAGYSRTTIGPGVKYADIQKAFQNKNNKTLSKLKRKYEECSTLIREYNNKIDEYNSNFNDIEQNINQIDNQIQGLERQIEELKKQKQGYEQRKSAIVTNRDQIFKEQGIIETKKQDLLKSTKKHVKYDAKPEDLDSILANLSEGKIFYAEG